MIYVVPKLNSDGYSVARWYQPTVKHIHQDWEIFTITHGNATDIINDAPYTSKLCSFTLLGPQHTHQQIAKEPITRLDLCISSESFEKYCDEFYPELYSELLSIEKPITITPSVDTYHEIVQRLYSVENIKPINRETGKHISHSIVSYLLGFYLENKSETNEQIDFDWFANFIKKINNPAVFSKKVEDIISETGYSHAHFLILFKKYSGKTLIDYLANIRLSYAKRLLSYTDMSVIEIAESVGYSNHSFFSQRFKLRYKTSPSEFRKNLLK